MKRKIFTTTAIILFLGIVQFITYYTIANDKLSEQAIKNIEVTKQLASDTIIFSPVITVLGNQQGEIKPYELHLSNKKYFKLIQKKLAPSAVVEETEYATYCEKISQEAFKQMDSTSFLMFNDNLHNNKSKLYITALEDHKFFVTVNYNWSANKQFFYEEDEYIWIFFSWLKI
ncbi:MAG TPA: hypothetical protein VK796_09650 [Cytophaga sp.]|jgi:hypothetical protein|nr:hypothetical protein [Cytophaga sp.]